MNKRNISHKNKSPLVLFLLLWAADIFIALVGIWFFGWKTMLSFIDRYESFILMFFVFIFLVLIARKYLGDGGKNKHTSLTIDIGQHRKD